MSTRLGNGVCLLFAALAVLFSPPQLHAADVVFGQVASVTKPGLGHQRPRVDCGHHGRL